jgi:hypothetical protein
MKPKSKILKIVMIVIGVPVAIAAVGFVTMSLWNALIPVLFSGPVVSFWQALGLLLLSKLLFGGFKGRGGRCGGGRHGREHWRQKMEARMASMTEEEKEKFRNRCGNKF